MNFEIAQLVVFGLLFFISFLFGRLTKKAGLGESSGQILGGILIGPCLFKLLAFLHFHTDASSVVEFLKAYDPVQMKALFKSSLVYMSLFLPVYITVMIFALAEDFHINRLKETGKKALIMSLVQNVLTFAAVFSAFRWAVHLDLFHSLLVAALALSVSPVSALIAFNEHQVEGKMKSTWAQACIFDLILQTLVLLVIFYGFADQWEGVALPHSLVKLMGVSILIGFVIFYLIKYTIQNRMLMDDYLEDSEGENSKHNIAEMLALDAIPSVSVLIVVWGAVAIGCGLLLSLNFSLAVGIITAGILISNYHSQFVFDSLKVPELMRIFNLMFCTFIGASLDLSQLLDFETLSVVLIYMCARTLMKIISAWLVARFVMDDRRLCRVLPYLSISHAGIPASSMALTGFYFFSSTNEVLQTVLPAMILLELIGSLLNNYLVKKWKRYQQESKDEKMDSTVQRKEIQQLSLESLMQDRVIVDMDVRTREDAIKMLTAELVKYGSISEIQNIINLVLEREKLCSTAVGEEVAIPHCRTGDVDYPMVACAFMAEGESLDWDAFDGLAVRYIFLIVSPLSDPNMHIEAMKTITTHLHQEGFMDRLKEAAHKGEVIDLLHDL